MTKAQRWVVIGLSFVLGLCVLVVVVVGVSLSQPYRPNEFSIEGEMTVELDDGSVLAVTRLYGKMDTQVLKVFMRAFEIEEDCGNGRGFTSHAGGR